MLCPSPSDPFAGPHYRIAAMIHQPMLILLSGKLYSIIVLWLQQSIKSPNFLKPLCSSFHWLPGLTIISRNPTKAIADQIVCEKTIERRPRSLEELFQTQSSCSSLEWRMICQSMCFSKIDFGCLQKPLCWVTVWSQWQCDWKRQWCSITFLFTFLLIKAGRQFLSSCYISTILWKKYKFYVQFCAFSLSICLTIWMVPVLLCMLVDICFHVCLPPEVPLLNSWFLNFLL